MKRPAAGVALSIAGVLALTVAAALLVVSKPRAAVPGFSPARAASHAAIERRFIDLPDVARIRDAHRFLTEQPHVAGSDRDRELAEWTRDRFREAGFDEVEIVEHDVLLPWPVEIGVEMTAPRRWTASLREDPLDDTAHADADVGLPYHAYSASGDVTAPVVYAGLGDPADYDWLASQGIDVRGRIVIVRYSHPYSYRGFKAFTAQARGAAGILMYSDPIDDGAAKGQVFPGGPWSPETRIERGGIGYDFLVPGDPLTPGWASIPGARRLSRSEAPALPAIVSAPLSARDAQTILATLEGIDVPERWRGALPIRYRAGPGAASVRLRVQLDDRIRTIWTVTALLKGSDSPDDLVIVGNHRDAWIYGGVDPSSGSAALVELARTIGELTKAGWRPRRSIMLASWDAEEFSLISSTEWAEQHADRLRRHAVAYLNVDSAASGRDLAIASVPALNPVIDSVAHVVRDPASRLTLAASARDRVTREQGVTPDGTPADFIGNRIGGGSDYTAFLNFVGVPVADFSFRGPYGVYHSIYDNHRWVAEIGDPGFQYHAALVRLWGAITLRLASADVVPLDYAPYAARIEDFAREVGGRWNGIQPSSGGDPLHVVRAAATRLRRAAHAFNERRERALATGDVASFAALDAQLMAAERTFIDPNGLPGRPWYRHVVYAPKFSYAPEVLPGIAEAIEQQDFARAGAQAQGVADALSRVAAVLDPGRN